MWERVCEIFRLGCFDLTELFFFLLTPNEIFSVWPRRDATLRKLCKIKNSLWEEFSRWFPDNWMNWIFPWISEWLKDLKQSHKLSFWRSKTLQALVWWEHRCEDYESWMFKGCCHEKLKCPWSHLVHCIMKRTVTFTAQNFHLKNKNTFIAIHWIYNALQC